MNTESKNPELFRHIIAVTNRSLSVRPFPEQIKLVCSLHPRALLLREKDLSETAYTELAAQVLKLCAAYEVPCILHSFPEAAISLGCTAIHLPLPLLEKYQNQLSRFTVIGSSVHSAAQARQAAALGATYLTAGHIFTTDCKKGLAPRGLSFLREVTAAVSIPVYGIGGIGIDAGQIAQLMECGAAGGCIMSGLMRYGGEPSADASARAEK